MAYHQKFIGTEYQHFRVEKENRKMNMQQKNSVLQ